MERARVDAACLDVLNPLWLAGRLVDREHDDAVLAALEHLLPLIVLGLLGPVRAVHKAAIRMDVHGAGRLPRPDVVRLGQGARDKRPGGAGFLFGGAGVPATRAGGGAPRPFSTGNIIIWFWVSIET